MGIDKSTRACRGRGANQSEMTTFPSTLATTRPSEIVSQASFHRSGVVIFNVPLPAGSVKNIAGTTVLPGSQNAYIPFQPSNAFS